MAAEVHAKRQRVSVKKKCILEERISSQAAEVHAERQRVLVKKKYILEERISSQASEVHAEKNTSSCEEEIHLGRQNIKSGDRSSCEYYAATYTVGVSVEEIKLVFRFYL